MRRWQMVVVLVVVVGMPSLLDSKGLSGGVTRGLVLSGAILAARIPRRLGRLGRQKAEAARRKTCLLKWPRLALPTGANLRVHEFRKGHPTIRLSCGFTSKDWEAGGKGRKKTKQRKTSYILGSAASAILSIWVVTHEVLCQSSPSKTC